MTPEEIQAERARLMAERDRLTAGQARRNMAGTGSLTLNQIQERRAQLEMERERLLAERQPRMPRSSNPQGSRPGAQTVTPQTGYQRARARESAIRDERGPEWLRPVEDFNRWTQQIPANLGFADDIGYWSARAGQSIQNVARRATGRPVEISSQEAAQAAYDDRNVRAGQYDVEHPGLSTAATVAGIPALVGAPLARAPSLLTAIGTGAAYNTGLGIIGRHGSLQERIQGTPETSPLQTGMPAAAEDALVGGAVPIAFRAAGDTINFARSVYRNMTGAARRAPHPLERRFGNVLTEGERSGDTGVRLEEDALRRGDGSTRSQAIISGHDAQRAPVIRQQLTNIATRGQPALSQNADEAGVRLADELRNAREALHARQSDLYDEAFKAARAEPIAASDELPSAIAAAEDELGFRAPPAARSEIEVLHDKIRRGNATQADVQRTRQRLNRLRSTAINARDDAAEFDINETIGALSRWRAGLPRDPEAVRLMSEADAVHGEMRNLFSAQGRVGLSTGHTGRIDLGGRAVDRAINIEGESGILDAILGKGGAGSSQSALAAVRRIRRIGTGRIKYTNRSAPSGVRVPGRTSVGNDGSRLDMRLTAARRFAADTPDSPVAQQHFGGQAQQPEPVLQSLREGVMHRLSSNWDRYIRAIEEGGQARIAPTQRLWNDLDTALNGSGAPVMRELFTEGEIATLREFQDFVKRMIPPAGANTSNTKIAIFRAVQKGFDRLIGLIPGIGPVIRELGEQAGSVTAARRAVRPPGNAPPPITDNLPRRMQQLGAPLGAAAPPEMDETLQDVTGISSLRQAGRDVSAGKYGSAGANAIIGGLSLVPGAAGAGPLTRTAALATGATLVGAGVAQASEERGQQQQTLETARASVQQLEANAQAFSQIDRSDREAVRQAQEFLQSQGLYLTDNSGREVVPDGEWGSGTTIAVREYLERNATELERARAWLAEAEAEATSRATRASPLHEGLRELGPLAAMAGGAYLGHRFRVGAVRKANARLEELNRDANALLTPGPVMRGRSAAAQAEPARRAAYINDFWRLGGAGERVPFAATKTPRGFRRRGGAADPATLYPQESSRFRGTDIGMIGAGLGEAGVSGGALYLAQQELAEAQAAANQSPSEANLTRLERARDAVAVLQSTMRAGIGVAMGRAGGAVIHPYARGRPNIAEAERERLLLDQHLSRRR